MNLIKLAFYILPVLYFEVHYQIYMLIQVKDYL